MVVNNSNQETNIEHKENLCIAKNTKSHENCFEKLARKSKANEKPNNNDANFTNSSNLKNT